ncbi:hypothetical protein [Nocardioides sp.]|uniref:hypothetical protein n=1 Tax=Nocardioides sp. TaxID=35761 RepID=UPI0037834BC8
MLDDFSRDHAFHLLFEVDEAVALGRSALRVLDSMRSTTESHAAVLALLSIAAEKTLKLTLGLHATASLGTWPSVNKMRGYRHNIVRLDQEVTELYRTNLERSRVPGTLAVLIEETQGDPVLQGMLEVLSNWGGEGRFIHLDELAGRPQGVESAQLLWDETEQIILQSSPELLRELITARGDVNPRAGVNAIMSGSVRRWWELHVRAWMTGTIGEPAKQLSVNLGRVLEDLGEG